MKYIRLIVINLIVLSILILVMATVAYFIGVKRINTFFEFTSEKHIDYLLPDSTAMFVHKPNILIYDNWGTENQVLTTERRTNNLGFREDDDITDKKSNEIRILVTGDSHTDGVLKHNTQSFVNIWELSQNSQDTLKTHNYINGGTAFYTFRNYLGFLKKYKHLNPDVYLINIFTGNDFREAPMFEENRKDVGNVYKNIVIRTKRKFFSKEKKALPFTQGIEQTLYFKAFPEEKEKALDIAKKYLLEIINLCKKENIKLIVTLLPSKIETKPEFKKDIQKLFNLDESDIKINQNLTEELISWLDKMSVKNYNLTEPLKKSELKVFWDEDLHINPEGHKIIAEFLSRHQKEIFQTNN